jgi:hypothetical protein
MRKKGRESMREHSGDEVEAWERMEELGKRW